jgi:hypothetical protein
LFEETSFLGEVVEIGSAPPGPVRGVRIPRAGGNEEAGEESEGFWRGKRGIHEGGGLAQAGIFGEEFTREMEF